VIIKTSSGKPPDGVRSAFSLLEVVVSTFIVGILLVVAMQTAGSVASGQLRSAEQGRARLLAAELMGEVFQQGYREPLDAALFGPEPGESASGTRTDFDDVDDYHGWTASPPVDKQGNELTGRAGWHGFRVLPGNRDVDRRGCPASEWGGLPRDQGGGP